MGDHPQATETWIDVIATPFDRAWRAGQRPRIEDYLADISEPRRGQLLEELLRVERENREILGEAPTLEEYRSRFPGAEAVVDAVYGARPASLGATIPQKPAGAMTLKAPDPGGIDGGQQLCRPDPDARPVVSWIPRAENPPDAGVSFFLGSRRRTEVTLSAISADQSGLFPFLNDEWGVERYAPIRSLGEGAFGVVYLADDRELNRKVALKLPKRPRITSEQDAVDFLFEARNLATLDHPGIVPIYDVGRAQDGRCYVVSKYIRGEDLGQRLKRCRRLGPKEAAELVLQVASALHHAHEVGLVHRDVKTANILLSELDQAYVTDFGLALKTEDVQLASQVAGTPAYMSPEQITGDVSHLDGRSDIFSLGVVLYELLTGYRPFQGKSLADLLTKICSRTPKSPDQGNWGVPSTLSAICMKCLAKQPADRFQTGKQLADELHRWLLEGTEHAELIAPPPPDRRFGVVWAMALGALVLVLGNTIWFRSTPQLPAASQNSPAQPNGGGPVQKVYIRVPVYVEDDPPPIGISRELWARLPEEMKESFRETKHSFRTPSDRWNTSRRRRPLDPWSADPWRGLTDPSNRLGPRPGRPFP
jgi:serine/threonine protein kinase